MARKIAAQPVTVVPKDNPDFTETILRALWALIKWMVRHPILTFIAAGIGFLAWAFGWPGPVIGAGSTAVLLGVWFVAHRETFARWVRPSLVGNWRRCFRYWPRWDYTMTGCGLTSIYDRVKQVPGLVRVRSEAWRDRLLVRMLPGQTLAGWQGKADELAEAFGAMSCLIRRHRRGAVWVEFTSRDLLTDTILALDVPESPNLKRLVLGKTADGSPWRLRLLGTHILLAGATGAGKGSILWSLLRSVAVMIRDGSVEVWVIDPKGGMELFMGRPLFTRYEDTELADMAALLEDAVKRMRERQGRLKGVTRQHTPERGDPLVLIVIDEVANLTAYVTDRDVKKRIANALSLLLSQGRAVGFNVVGALQDPRKDVLPFRNLFPTRIAMRLTEPDEVDLVLGDGARERGAACHEIPEEGAEGTAFVLLDGKRDPARVRAAFPTDPDIREMAREYAPGRPPTGLNVVREAA